MRAAVLQKDRSVTIKSVPVPKLLPRSVRVKVLAVQMAPYTTDVVSGKLGYRHGEPPVILGCSGVGEVLEVAEDVHDVKPGDIVFCDPMVGNPSNQGHYDWILQGWTALSPESMLTQKKYPSGTLAEQYVTPAECLTRIDRPEMQPMARWSTLIWFSIAQGALTRGSIQAGQVVAVTGATGGLGSCAVLLALAAGASKVLALGRNTSALQRLRSLDARVVAMPLMPDEPPLQSLQAALGGKQMDLAIDSMGQADSPDITMACISSLKRRGILVLVGSMTCPLPNSHGDLFRRELEIRGSYMSSRETPSVLIRLMESGLLDMNQLDVKTFPLEEVTRCVEFAHKCSALQFSILEPSS